MSEVKCKLKACICYEKIGRTGYCYQDVPTIVKQLKPNDTSCYYYATSQEDELKWLKKNGGVMNLIKTTQKGRRKRLKEVDDEEGEDI